MEFWLLLCIILFLALCRTPLFLVISALTILFFLNADESLASIIVSFTELSKQSILLAIPLFTFSGFVLSESGTPKRLVNLASSFFGFLPGGIAIVSLICCAIFTAFTGASGVTIIALGGLLYPILIQQKYPESFSLGLLTTSGSLGLLFPPSLPLIVYGIVSQTDISKLFKGGILPGILLLLILGVYSLRVGKVASVPREKFPIISLGVIQNRLNKKNVLRFIFSLFIFYSFIFQLVPIDTFLRFIIVIFSAFFLIKSLILVLCSQKVIDAFHEAKYELFLPILILGGIYSGQFTATESATVTALYVVIIECFVYRDINFFKDMPRIVKESMILVGAILIIMAAAFALTNFLVDEEVPNTILEFIRRYIDSKIVFLIALNILLLIVGSMMDIFSAILVVVPIITPIAAEYQVDPVHLGIIFLTNLEIGYMTPPVGLNLFIASFRFKKNILTLYKASIKYILMLLVALSFITYIPEISLIFVD